MTAALKKPEPDTPPATVPYSSIKIAGLAETIEVASHELPHLISTGFIVDPNAPPPPAADDQKDGPTKIESCMKKCQGITGYNEWVPGQTLGDLIEP